MIGFVIPCTYENRINILRICKFFSNKRDILLCLIVNNRLKKFLKTKSINYKNIKIILTEAIEQNGTTIIDFSVNGESGKYTNELKIYGKVNSNCYRCKYKIMKIRVAGRGTYICKKCQKKYK